MASRNRKSMSQNLFERLIAAAKQRGVAIQAEDQPRYIRRLSVDDSSLMAQAEISARSLSRSQKLVRIKWKEETYLVIFGFNEPDPVPLGFESADLTPGIFVASVLEANVFPSSMVTGSQIKNAIESDHAGIENYEGHDLVAITPLFPQCVTFRVTAPESYISSDHRILGAIVARSYTDGPLHIDPTTLQLLASLFESGSEFLPYHILLQGVLSFSWDNLFLETYRCLEQLYAQPRVAALTSAWSSPLALKQVVELLEQHLSWRPKEDEALSGLVGACDSASLQRLCFAFDVSYSVGVADKSSETAAGRIYKLRNNIVHYRPIHKAVVKSDNEWNLIIQAMLIVLDDIYTKLGGNFFQSSQVQT